MSMSRVYIIAEAGVNHNGSVAMAKQLIDAAVEAGADAVKFQTFIAEKVMSRYAPKAKYQTVTTDVNESQLDMVKKLQLDAKAHLELNNYCCTKRIQFLSTPFDLDSASFLATKLNLPKIKISSGEITNAPLLLKVAQTGKPILLSTGISTIGEIEAALGVLAFGYIKKNEKPSPENFLKAFCLKSGQKALKKNVYLLHCTTEYPTPFSDVNLKVMDTLRSAFGLPVGLSDHTTGIAIPIAAVARGAAIIEKHFTLDRNLPGPDHRASLEPSELKLMVQSIRQVEEALGSGIKVPAPSEMKNKSIARKSLVASRNIKKGEKFTEENLTVKRPGTGMAPIKFWSILGKAAEQDYVTDEELKE